MSTKLPVSLKPEDDNLHNLQIATQDDDKLAIQQDGPRPSKKLCLRYNNTEPSMKNYNPRQVSTKRYKDHNTQQEKRRYSKTNTQRSFRSQQM